MPRKEKQPKKEKMQQHSKSSDLSTRHDIAELPQIASPMESIQPAQHDSIPPRLHIRYKLADGRCSCLVVWPDGEWKVEIFPSVDHVMLFVKHHNMELLDHDDDTSTERE